MKKPLNLLALLGLLYFCIPCAAQNLKTDSIFNWGASGWELPADMVTDHEGNFYVTGSFSGEMAIGNQTVKSNGKRDVFLAKFSKENQLLWAKNLGGQYDDNAYSLLVSQDYLYLSGSFRKEIQMNATTKLQGKGLTDVFISKMSPDGNLLWAKAITSDAPAQKAILQADSASNIWLAGSFSKTAGINGQVLSSNSGKGIYCIAFDQQGNILKSFDIAGKSELKLNDFVFAKGNTLCLAGTFTESMDVSGKSISSNGKTDGFIALLDTTGHANWIRNLGGAYEDEIKSLAIDKQGNLYAAGDFKFAIQLDKEYQAKQNTDAFVVKLTPSNELLWAIQAGTDGESYNTMTDIELAGENHFYLSGAFRGKLQNSPEIKSAGNSKNAFVARYTTDGKKDWTIGIESKSDAKLWAKYNPHSKAVFISGYFSEGFKLGDFEIKNQNYKDILFGSLVDCDLAYKANLGPDTTLCTGVEIKPNKAFANYLWNTGETKESIKPTLPGTYSVLVSDKSGCKSVDSISIALLPAPVFDLGKDQAICHGKGINLHAPQGYASFAWDNGSTESLRMLSETGKYWLKVSDTLGCSTTDTLNLKVNALPEFDLGETQYLKAGDTLVLNPIIPAGNYTFLWSNGTQGQYLTMLIDQNMNSRTIGLTVIDANQCSFTDDVFISVSGRGYANSTNLGLNQFQGYNVYPNPSHGKFNLSIPSPLEVKKIHIFNSAGREVSKITKLETDVLEIDLSTLPKGTYLIRISENQKNEEIKIILN